MVFYQAMENHDTKKHRRLLALFWRRVPGVIFILLGLLAFPSWAGAMKQLAVFPLTMNAPDRLEYLREGIEDMLSSRLAWEGKVSILNRSQIQKALEKNSGPLDKSQVLKVGKELGADVVLWGSITVIGSNVSLDLNVFEIASDQPVKKFYAQAKGMDEVIPKVGEVADEIGEKVFGREKVAAPAVPAAAPAAKSAGPAPEPGAPAKPPISLKGLTINPLSPQIIMNAGGFDLAGVWRSAVLPYALVDMAFGDLDGDGKNETVLISKNKIHIYRYDKDRFQVITEISGGRFDNFIAVDVGNINKTAHPQIFVTNFRSGALHSLVLSWVKGDYKIIAEDIGYYLRIHQIPGKGSVLLGQKPYGEMPFDDQIYILSWKNGKYRPEEKLKLPEKKLNVYNFIYEDLNNDGEPEILYLNNKNHLVILTEKGKELYSSQEFYGGTVNFVRTKNEQDYFLIDDSMKEDEIAYIPARLVVTPILTSGKKEIVLNKNKGSFLNILARFRSYTSGEIFSLSWDGSVMKENWKTQTINDYISNYGIGDFKNNGQRQLVVGVVQSTGPLPFLTTARSVLYSYDLGTIVPDQKKK
jgi:FG-GAP-like repeat